MSESASPSDGIQPFDPLEFFKFAQQLGNSRHECILRTAVGRAYYAMFLLVRQSETINRKRSVYPRGNEGEHDYIIRLLGTIHGSWTTVQQLRDLRNLRVVADYQMIPEDPEEDDWTENWKTASALVAKMLPRVQQL